MERYFWHLTDRQAVGLACVLCGADFRREGPEAVPVGRSAERDGEVSACRTPCVEQIAAEAQEMADTMRAAAAPSPAPGWGADSSPSAYSVDGAFGELLRDLHMLTGAEAMLTTSDEQETVRWLLALSARHSEAAMTRARLLLAQMARDGEG
ncbi:hypothetical protein [Streptomyces sp. AM 3-1-1]|uniref:hypothetical protein n=1 Tax=Streptomyces sp. AM 3-1-1 TaxID=3028711 RepID=UPI0023B91C85|nr:hypothetical protein [Streptomyces sp. AM 3-1-1]WEH29083.1 hypothetical protein P0D76_18125 [Streptomyces sp. AM 3-1-1]